MCSLYLILMTFNVSGVRLFESSAASFSNDIFGGAVLRGT
jgi:hypothetical protein